MKTVINAVGYYENISLLLNNKPSGLLQIVNKPIIVHIIEFLKRQGITKCDIILNHLPQMIENTLEEGHRWGIDITYHLTQHAEYPFNAFKHSAFNYKEENFLIVHANTLPFFDFNLFIETASHSPALIYFPNNTWTGWSIVNGDILSKLPHNTTENGFLDYIKTFPFKIMTAQPFLSVNSYHEIEKSNRMLLQSNVTTPFFPSTAVMREPGVWLSHADDIHPSVQIRPPVFIGEHTQIKENCQIGPNAVIENNCIIDANSIVEDSLVCQRSYVGEGLGIRQDIVDRNLLINLSLDAQIVVKDAFILSELSTSTFKGDISKFINRIVALGVMLLFSLPLAYIFYRKEIVRTRVVLLPLNATNAEIKTVEWISLEKPSRTMMIHSFSNFLIELTNIVKGHAQFVGVSPTSLEDFKKLPNDWRNIYGHSKLGLITLASLENKEPFTDDDLYSAETFYTVHMGLWFDIKLIFHKFTKWFGWK